MNVFDLLTQEDKELISAYIEDYATTNDGGYLPSFNMETVLSEWASKKDENLIKLFNNKLILRRPYTYVAKAEGLAREIKQHFGEPQYRNMFQWFTNSKYHSAYDFNLYKMDGVTPYDQGVFTHTYAGNKWFFLETCFGEETLANNAYDHNEYVVEFKSGKRYKIFKGMKPMKIIHRFIEEFGNCSEDTYDAFRTWHSMLLNQRHMDGELCLSIHPLDYMTMSDNANGWTSCMRWNPASQGNHGDYRAGTVECMNSPYMVIAYLHNPKKVYEFDRCHNWNSKQWRELFLVQDGIITEIKGYPFQDENLTNTCLMWIKELASANLGWEYEPEEVNTKADIPLSENEDGYAQNIYFEFDPSQYMYNDMGTLTKHRGRINHKILLDEDKYFRNERIERSRGFIDYFITIPYGGVCTCMCCGETIYGGEETSVVLCGNCDAIDHCANCGCSLSSSDGRYWIEDIEDYYCEDCYCNYCTDDQITGEPHLVDNMTVVSLLLGYNDCDEPVYADEKLWIYDPEYNWQYQNLVSDKPKWDSDNCVYYITPDMVRGPSAMKSLTGAMEMWPAVSYATTLWDNYEVYYDWNGQPLFEEEKEK